MMKKILQMDFENPPNGFGGFLGQPKSSKRIFFWRKMDFLDFFGTWNRKFGFFGFWRIFWILKDFLDFHGFFGFSRIFWIFLDFLDFQGFFKSSKWIFRILQMDLKNPPNRWKKSSKAIWVLKILHPFGGFQSSRFFWVNPNVKKNLEDFGFRVNPTTPL